MQHQFKAGDLALVIGSSSGTSPNIGMSVELVAAIDKDEKYQLPDGRSMTNRGPKCWVVHGDGAMAQLHAGGLVDLGGIFLAVERYLMPLKGDQSPTQTNTETPKEVVHG